MIAITTSSSTKVNALRFGDMRFPPWVGSGFA
jgi:hypothetical protein